MIRSPAFFKSYRRRRSFILQNSAFSFMFFILLILVFQNNNPIYIQFFTGIILAFLISFLSIKIGFLTVSGAFAAFLIAVPVFGFGGLKWSIPLLAFFILSSLLSKFSENRNPVLKNFYEKPGKRDYLQVLANGGIAASLVILNQILSGREELIYMFFVSSLASVCADTWSTETGTIFKGRTVNILNFRKVAPGTSGGISAPGTFGGAAGAFIIALSAFFWIEQNILNYIILITAAGLFGSIADSLIGAAFQRKNLCSACGRFTERTEHCGKTARHYSGIKWVSNDLVNLCCSAAGAAFAYLAYKIL